MTLLTISFQRSWHSLSLIVLFFVMTIGHCLEIDLICQVHFHEGSGHQLLAGLAQYDCTQIKLFILNRVSGYMGPVKKVRSFVMPQKRVHLDFIWCC